MSLDQDLAPSHPAPIAHEVSSEAHPVLEKLTIPALDTVPDARTHEIDSPLDTSTQEDINLDDTLSSEGLSSDEGTPHTPIDQANSEPQKGFEDAHLDLVHPTLSDSSPEHPPLDSVVLEVATPPADDAFPMPDSSEVPSVHLAAHADAAAHDPSVVPLPDEVEVEDSPSALPLPDESFTGPRVFYEAAGAYVLPADDNELSRLNLQHFLITTHLGRLYLPDLSVETDDEVLDSGCGTGRWIFDAAKISPMAQFTGTDISPRLFPTDAPTNMTFTTANTLSFPSEWTDKFTLVNQRMLLGAFTKEQWPVALSELFRVVKPGGWLQLTEGTRHRAGPAAERHLQLLDAVFDARGLFFDVGYHLAEMVKAAGFEHVTEERKTVHLGKWAGDLGALCKRNVVSTYRAMKAPVMKAGGFGFVDSEEDYDAMMDAVSEELDSTEGASMNWIAVYAQKPLTHSSEEVVNAAA